MIWVAVATGDWGWKDPRQKGRLETQPLLSLLCLATSHHHLNPTIHQCCTMKPPQLPPVPPPPPPQLSPHLSPLWLHTHTSFSGLFNSASLWLFFTMAIISLWLVIFGLNWAYVLVKADIVLFSLAVVVAAVSGRAALTLTDGGGLTSNVFDLWPVCCFLLYFVSR